jgi:signal-transduction protein with cAMP-binding, CBS, and nucleotidyltransferase domain
MMEKVNPLNNSEIEALTQDFELLTFPNDFDLVYENQVPCAGIALIEGQIDLIKDSKVEQVIGERCILGVRQLLGEEPVKYGCRVKAKSKIILLGKSDILSFGSNKKSKLHPLFKAIKTG